MLKEKWEKIDFVPGLDHYEVSTDGNLRKTVSKELMSNHLCKKNFYLKNGLTNSMTKKVKHWNRHHLVFFQFNKEINYFEVDLGYNSDSMVVNHIDENKINNKLNNLNLITRKENTQYSCNLPILGINKNDFSDIEYYESIKAVGSHNISTVLGNPNKTIYDRYWLTQDGDVEEFVFDIEKIQNELKIVGIEIKNPDNFLIFSSQHDACSKHNFTQSCISRCLSGERNQHGGFKWMRYNDFLQLNKE